MKRGKLPKKKRLDEEYLKVDAQLGGMDQKKIFELSDKYFKTENFVLSGKPTNSPFASHGSAISLGPATRISTA